MATLPERFVADLGHLKFADGYTVHLESALVLRTYAGVLEGRPSPELNRARMDAMAEAAKRTHTTKRVTRVPGAVTTDQRGNPQLPGFSISAPCVCHTPAKDKSRMMSHAVLVWTQSEPWPFVGPALQEWASRTNWVAVSEDGDW